MRFQDLLSVADAFLISRICRLHSPRCVCPSVLTGPVPSVAVSLSVLREFFIFIRKTPSVLLDFFALFSWIVLDYSTFIKSESDVL